MNDYIKLALSEIPLYFMNLMELFVSPKQFLSGKCTDDADAINKAAIFAGISLLLAFIIQIPSMPKDMNLANQLVVSLAILLLLLLATVLALRLAWRWVGGTASLRQLMVCTAYVLGPMLIICLVCTAVGFAIFRDVNPEGYALLRAHPLAALPEESLAKGGALPFLIAAMIGIVGATAWFIVAWGAYREINGVSKPRSAAAFFLYNVIQIPLLYVAYKLGEYITP